MIDFSKTPEEIKYELTEMLYSDIAYNNTYTNYYEAKIKQSRAYKVSLMCAIIMVKCMIQVCSKEKYGEHAMCGWVPYPNPNYSKLVRVMELLENG